MTDQTVSAIAPPHPVASTVPQIAVLAALAATGTLATNILLPSLPQMALALNVSSAAVTSAITVFLAVFAIGQLAVGPISDRYGRRWPVLIGFAVFCAGSIWCAFAHDLTSLLIGRSIQAAGACSTSVLSRAIARDLFSGAALARAMALIMIAMAAAPGFSPLLGGALDHYFGWRSEFAFVGIFAATGAIAYDLVFGETHRSTRIPLNPLAIARNYLGLIVDRRFLVPAATVSLIMGGLFAMFAAAPRILIEGLQFKPIQLGLFFAGTVMVVFSAGMLATRLAPRFGLDRSIKGGVLVAAAGSIAILLVSLLYPAFLPFLAAMCVFLLGMGIVNPLGTAQALSPFGEKAGAASALLGFWQMMAAAIGVWLAATVSPQAMFALGLVLTVASLAAAGLYTMRARDSRQLRLVRQVARIAAGHRLACGNVGIEGVEILRAPDAAQREPAGRDQIAPAGRIQSGPKGRRRQQVAVDRTAHRSDPADLVDRRPHHREIEPVLAADIAVEHFADMQTDIGRCRRPALGGTAHIERGHVSPETMLGLQRRAPGDADVLIGKHREHAIAHQLQHIAAGIVDRIDGGLGIIVEKRNDFVGTDVFTDRRSSRAGRKTTAPR